LQHRSGCLSAILPHNVLLLKSTERKNENIPIASAFRTVDFTEELTVGYRDVWVELGRLSLQPLLSGRRAVCLQLEGLARACLCCSSKTTTFFCSFSHIVPNQLELTLFLVFISNVLLISARAAGLYDLCRPFLWLSSPCIRQLGAVTCHSSDDFVWLSAIFCILRISRLPLKTTFS